MLPNVKSLFLSRDPEDVHSVLYMC